MKPEREEREGSARRELCEVGSRGTRRARSAGCAQEGPWLGRRDVPSDCGPCRGLLLCADRVLEVEGDDVGLRGWREGAGEDLVDHLLRRAGNVEEGALRWSWRCSVGLSLIHI